MEKKGYRKPYVCVHIHKYVHADIKHAYAHLGYAHAYPEYASKVLETMKGELFGHKFV